MSLKLNSRRRQWLLWMVLSGILIAMFVWKLQGTNGETDQSIFMPGPLTDGHHQLADNCSVCHTDPLGGKEVLQKACVECHGDDRKKPMDSHPRNKFTDPRNADTLENIDALHCVTCHTEHKPEITLNNGLTQPVDVCFQCHKDIGEDRPSHKGMDFMSCKTAGCHNFHNNRALYTDFLAKHLNEPELLEKRKLPAREFSQVLGEITDYPREKYPVEKLNDLTQADAPASKLTDAVAHEWPGSSHARSGVNCTACHNYPETEQSNPQSSTVSSWVDRPDERGCRSCHQIEVDRFRLGKHGMRLAAGLPAMKVADARLPMEPDKHDSSITCNSCHSDHTFDTRNAAVDACLSCHADEHSKAYKQSPHGQLWVQEQAGEIKNNEGVSCASCHMPRVSIDVSEWLSRITVDHNQNANLSPNSKMIRSACLHCHGLEFSINALADEALIRNNFSGQPVFRTDSMRLVKEDLERVEMELESSRGK